MMMTWLLTSMTTDGWIKIGVCWGFIALVAAIMITAALIDKRFVNTKKTKIKNEVTATTANENSLETPEARDRRMQELYEKVWGPERKREELERKMKEVNE